MDLKSTLICVPIVNIKMHECFQATRLEKTMLAISTERVLLNPIVVMKITETEYMIIDGVHRFLSLKELGFEYVPCQVVQDSDIKLNMWSHLVKHEWLKNMNFRKLTKTQQQDVHKRFVFQITDSKSVSSYYYLTSETMMERVEAMHSITDCYKFKPFSRVSEIKKQEIGGEDLLVEFGKLSYQDIIDIVYRNERLPTGVTHFTINNRLLNVRIPLEFLETTANSDVWENFLFSIQPKLRHYPESVFYCE